MKRFALLLLAALLNVSPLDAETLVEVQKSFAAQQEKIGTNHKEELGKLGAQLIVAMGKGREAAKKAGDLDAVKAFDAEIERWKEEGDLPLVDDDNPEIGKFHETYRKAVKDLQVKKQRAVVAWYEGFEKELNALEKSLVAADRIGEAEQVRSERDTIRESLTVKEAMDAVKAADAMVAPAKAPGPPAEKAWLSLKGVKWKKAEGGSSTDILDNFDEAMIVEDKQVARSDYIFSHAPIKIEYEFQEPITRFRATACLSEQMPKGDVTFHVETSAGEVFKSKDLKGRRRQEKIDVTFKPTKSLILIVKDNGNLEEDWAFWLKPEYR